MSALRKSQLVFAAAGLLLAWSEEASAASGVVKGKIQFWQKQGNYCPSFRDCTGSNYLEADYDTAQPVAQVQIQVVDASNLNNVLGQGTTDVNGNYQISWSTASTPPSAKILWKARHKDSVFEVVSASSGGIYYFTSGGSFTLTSGTTSGSPQTLSTYTWGNSASPESLANLYDGAWRTWYYALRYSGLMTSRFTGVKVRAYDTSCPTSCASGSTKTVTIDSATSAFQPQGRIMHELGHIASYLSKPFVATLAYNYPSTSCPAGSTCGWSLNSAEWQSSSFEEGIATFFGDVANYWFDAPVPTTCLSSSWCSTAAFNVETSSGLNASCATDEERWAISVERFLWDVYDDQVDTNYNDSVSISFSQFFSTLDGYASGFSNRQIDEAWSSSSYTTIDNHDGRNQDDFVFNLNSVHSVNAATQADNNCVP
ncbi:hypothetical protein [Sorangium sp. So ce542]|uniref:hypothetical protein n=1 Tax=Sorangium sp. So ce542 TaxID=3133316 RepID=UPI003F5F8F3D